MSDVVVVATPRLRLREFPGDDADAVHAYGSDPEVVRSLPWGPNTEAEARAFLSRAVLRREWHADAMIQ